MATDSFKVSLGIAQLPPEDIPPDLYDNFLQVYRALFNLQRGISQYTGIDAPDSSTWSSLTFADTVLSGNLTRLYVPASVAISRGQVVNLHNNAGVLNARLAQATSAATMAHGIANSAAAAGQIVEINWLRGTLDSVGGLVIGTLYWLSTVAGAIQNVAPSVAGQIQQPIGLAGGTSTLLMDIPLSYRQL